jgi:hypothetical protein
MTHLLGVERAVQRREKLLASFVIGCNAFLRI